MKSKQKITKSMTFAEVLQRYPQTVRIFLKHGMSCVGCPAAMQETLEQGCLAHGLDVNEIVAKLNKAIKKKK